MAHSMTWAIVGACQEDCISQEESQSKVEMNKVVN